MLLGNYSVIHKSPGKFFGGNTVSNVSSNFQKNGQLRAIYSNESVPNQWGLPVGYYSGWMLPRTAGYIVAYSENQLSSTASPVMGVNGDGTCDITTIALANLSLVVSSNGVCEISLSSTGELIGSLYANGTSEITFTASGTIGANAFATGVSEIVLNANAIISAIGTMTGSMNPFTELSPEGLANAVWNNPIRTLTSGGGGSGGATPQEIWEYSDRTLTSGGGGGASVADIWTAQISDYDSTPGSFANKFATYGGVSHIIDRSSLDDTSKEELKGFKDKMEEFAKTLKEFKSNEKDFNNIVDAIKNQPNRTTIVNKGGQYEETIGELLVESIPQLMDKLDEATQIIPIYEELITYMEQREKDWEQLVQDIINN